MLRKYTLLKMVTVVALLALVAWPAAEAQFGGGGFGGGGFNPALDVSQHWPKEAVSTGDLIVFRSQSGKSLYGYANSTGEFDKVSFSPHPDRGYVPIVSAHVAVVPGEGQLYSFSAATGKWATLELDKVEVDKVVVGADRANYSTDTSFHVFSNASGKWASVDLTKD